MFIEPKIEKQMKARTEKESQFYYLAEIIGIWPLSI